MNASFLGRRGFRPLGISAGLGLAASVALAAAPANDNFANAFLIKGLSGSTNGSNVGASLQTGEPTVIGAVGESVWYVWTAPANGAYTFTTAGSSFDSLLGIYTGSVVTNLTIVGEGYAGTNIGYLPATFNATAGTVYHVQVDGYEFGVPDGKIALRWNTNSQPSGAGDFLFASQATSPSASIPLYIASESELFPPQDPRGFMLATEGARLTVTRLKGATGRVQVAYTIANTFYTNFFTTNIFGTNINIEGVGTLFTTNILVSAAYQNNEYGRWVYLPTNYMLTNITGTNSLLFGNSMTVTNLPPSNVAPQFDCLNVTYPPGTNDFGGLQLVFTTNVFCITKTGRTSSPPLRPTGITCPPTVC